MQKSIPCCIMRGGTSRGVYLLEKDLPPVGETRDQILLRIMGSPDIRQIDGLGGATSVTSKVAILGPSTQSGADVDYTFAQVSVDKPVVSYVGNCGNISSGVGPFAIESGLVKPRGETTIVRIFNTNTQKTMLEEVRTPGDKVCYEGDFAIAGVPGTAAPVKVIVLKPAGTLFGNMLPTGNAIDTLTVPKLGDIQVSIVDVSNPLVFVRAVDVGLRGVELPVDIDGSAEMLERLECIRGEAARLLGLVEDAARSAWDSPTVPKMTIVCPPADYTATSGDLVSAAQIDLTARMMSMQKAHPTYAMTGAMCTAAAAVIPGTVVHSLRRASASPDRLRIGHPGGILEAGVDCTARPDGGVEIDAAFGYRTARMIMRGTVYC